MRLRAVLIAVRSMPRFFSADHHFFLAPIAFRRPADPVVTGSSDGRR
jgi:hypothetical protein